MTTPPTPKRTPRVPHSCRAVCDKSGDFEPDPGSRKPEAGSRPRPARLVVYQKPRNPSERQRGILTLLAEGLTQRQAAAHLGLKPRCVTSTLANMRARYTATTNEALVALAIRLQWIEIHCLRSDRRRLRFV
jgi:DNA-binding CsgD family transcriptional regulator